MNAGKGGEGAAGAAQRQRSSAQGPVVVILMAMRGNPRQLTRYVCCTGHDETACPAGGTLTPPPSWFL
jgi:hypothetical protein